MEIEHFTLDCEFDGHNGPLLSMALVANSNGYGMHYRILDAPPVQDPWVAEHVEPKLNQHRANQTFWCRLNDLGPQLLDFIGDWRQAIVIADSPVDIARFCTAISTGTDGGYAPFPLRYIRFEVHNVDAYPTDLEGAVQHNAWWDAMALRRKLQLLDRI